MSCDPLRPLCPDLFQWVLERHLHLAATEIGGPAVDRFLLGPLLAPLAQAYGYDKVLFGLIMILVLCHSGYAAVNAVVKAELFPAHVRALGVSLPYAIANVLFGGTAEYVAGWLKQHRIESAFYAYVAVIMLAVLLVFKLAKPNQAIALFPVVLLMYVPVSFYTDQWMYRRRQRKEPKQGGGPRAARR